MGRLLEVLGLKQIELENAPAERDFAAVDLEQLCPPTAPADTTLNREALVREAQEMSESAGFIGTRSRSAAPAAPAPANPKSPKAR
jgi:hypothetical protein